MSNIEHIGEVCIECGKFTDRRVYEDPYYIDKHGPLCEGCYDLILDKNETEQVENSDLKAEIAQLKAEVERLKDNYAALKDEFNRGAALAQQHCPKPPLGHSVFEGIPLLAAEVDRLTRDNDVSKWRFKIQIVDREGERFGPWNYIDAMVDDIGHSDKGFVLSPEEPLVRLSELRELEDEVERLTAHTWQAERAAVVAWMTARFSACNRLGRAELACDMPGMIEAGEHWPEGGKG